MSGPAAVGSGARHLSAITLTLDELSHRLHHAPAHHFEHETEWNEREKNSEKNRRERYDEGHEQGSHTFLLCKRHDSFSAGSVPTKFHLFSWLDQAPSFGSKTAGAIAASEIRGFR
jgi:hypothetical protein